MTELEHAIKHIKTRADAWAVKEVEKALSQEPTSEMVHVETLHQVMWERDIAIGQLKELGYEFGQKIEPCDDAISREELLKAIDTWDKFGVDDTNSLFRLDNLSLPHYVPYIHYDDVIKCIKGMPSITQKSGKIPDNATNGDVIKAMFPQWKLMENTFEEMVMFDIPMKDGYLEHNACSREWWNAPYQKGGK